MSSPQLLVVASGKGGIGKSLLSLAIADLFELNDRPLRLYQLDDQQRLEKAVGQSVVSLDIQTLKLARRDPTAITKVFDPLYRGIEELARSADTLLLDVGATQIGNLVDYAGLIDLEEDLHLFGLTGYVFVPAVAEPESLRQACRAIQQFRSTLPSLTPVFVENLRDGRLEDLSSASQAGLIYANDLRPLLPGMESHRHAADRSRLLAAVRAEPLPPDRRRHHGDSGDHRPDRPFAPRSQTGAGRCAGLLCPDGRGVEPPPPIRRGGRAMTANNERLRDLMAQATKDLRQGRSELLEALKHIPVRELHNADPTLFTRLTPDQRAELFSRMAQHPRRSGLAYSIPGRRPRPRSPSVIRRFWNRLPLTGRSQLVGLFAVSLMACLSVMIFFFGRPAGRRRRPGGHFRRSRDLARLPTPRTDPRRLHLHRLRRPFVGSGGTTARPRPRRTDERQPSPRRPIEAPSG